MQATTAITLPSAVIFGTINGGSSVVTLGNPSTSTAAGTPNSPIIFTGGVFLAGLSGDAVGCESGDYAHSLSGRHQFHACLAAAS